MQCGYAVKRCVGAGREVPMVGLPGHSLKQTRPGNVGEGECARHLTGIFEQT